VLGEATETQDAIEATMSIARSGRLEPPTPGEIFKLAGEVKKLRLIEENRKLLKLAAPNLRYPPGTRWATPSGAILIADELGILRKPKNV
jgi:hypothetical protein